LFSLNLVRVLYVLFKALVGAFVKPKTKTSYRSGI